MSGSHPLRLRLRRNQLQRRISGNGPRWNLLPDGCCRASWAYYIPPMARVRRSEIKNRREFPTLPVVGVGGVVIDGDTALLIRRGHEPLQGQWSIPGGVLELGETIRAGLAREMLEETGLVVCVGELIA